MAGIKTRNILRRKRLARIIAKGDVKTATEAMLAVGYSKLTAKSKQTIILNSPEVQGELRKYGFTEDAAKARVSSILNAPVVSEMITPDNQLRAAELAFRVFGSFAPEKLEVKKVIAHITFNKPR